jgi:UPF0755 protein
VTDLFFDQDDAAAEPGTATEAPRRRRRFGAWLTALTVVAVLFLIALGGGGLWLKGKIDPAGGQGEAVEFVVERGMTTSEVADALEEAGIITDAGIYRLYLRVRGGGPFQAGIYDLHRNSSMGDVTAALGRGPKLPDAVNLTIPEALVVEEVAARIARIERLSGERFLELARSGEIRSKYQPPGQSSLEGLLFPETYRVEERDDEEALLRRMVATFDSVAESLGYDDAQARIGRSPYEAIIVASLVEAEAKDDEDRGKIARVIYNRLEQGIPLGIDATFYFQLGVERKGTSLRQSDLDADHEYNTRKRAGLVPTPVAMSGRASLEAALNPEPGPWLYYVLKDARTHAFSESYEEFLRNKRYAQENGLIP